MSLKSSLFNVWRTPQRNPDIPKSFKFITVKSVRANVGAYERFRWTCIEVFPQNQSTLFLHSHTASHFSRAWNWFQVITKHLVIPALFTAYMLFPRFLPLTCFSCARHQIRNFPRLPLCYLFSRAWNRLHAAHALESLQYQTISNTNGFSVLVPLKRSQVSHSFSHFTKIFFSVPFWMFLFLVQCLRFKTTRYM